MKRKFFPIVLSAVLLALGCGISASCSGNDEFSFKVASGVRASLSDNGRYGFVLTVKGEGEIPDYASAKDAPWYRKSARVLPKSGITPLRTARSRPSSYRRRQRQSAETVFIRIPASAFSAKRSPRTGQRLTPIRKPSPIRKIRTGAI